MPGGFDWIGFLIAVAIIELTPGPNMGWLAALTLREGKKPAFAAVAGIATGLSLQLAAAVTGLTALIISAPGLHQLLHWAGVAFMLWLAWDAWKDGGSVALVSVGQERGFRRGLIANVLNPKALAFYVLLINQFVRTDAGLPIWAQSLILGLIHLTVATLVHAGIVLVAGRAGDGLERWRTSVPARLTFALMLVAIAVWLALTPPRS
ncbi:LysE family translocator [Hyphomonas sp.]|uniref:LysE family translocator n=1 Tax=Hyphomonas sp. TaxID=87 RepID=UPI003919E9CE